MVTWSSVRNLALWRRDVVAVKTDESIGDPILKLGRPLRLVSSH